MNSKKSNSKTNKPGPIIGPLVFNVYKPVGMSSFDVVRHFKRNLPKGFGKIGHFGTLDPFADGVLMIAVAGASRLNDYVHKYMPKTYVAKGKFGVLTPTGDLTVEEDEIQLDKDCETKLKDQHSSSLEKFLKDNFLGKYLQRPPAYSATKHEGKSLHKWAREGVIIEKPPVEREIYSLELISYDFPYFTFRATVSSGTYIRTLFTDFCEKLGTYGALEELTREAVGPVHMKDGILEANWPSKGLKGSGEVFDMSQEGKALDKVLDAYHLKLGDFHSKLYRNGNTISLEDVSYSDIESFSNEAGKVVWVYSSDDVLIGLGAVSEESKLKVLFNLPVV